MAEEKSKAAITFETLREIQRNERRNGQLYELDNRFYKRVEEYLGRKGTTDEELRNARYTLRDIIDRREKKILNQALCAARTNTIMDKKSMTKDEEDMFEELVDILRKYRVDGDDSKKTKKEEKKENEEPEPEKEETTRYIKVEVLEDLPEIVGSDMENYGPFKKGEVVELPKENADIYVENKKAAVVD